MLLAARERLALWSCSQWIRARPDRRNRL